jgi:hypothetical protein
MSDQIKPGLFSPKFEKEFNKFLWDVHGLSDKQVDDPKSIVEKAQALALKYPKLGYPLDAVMFLHAITSRGYRSCGGKTWDSRYLKIEISTSTIRFLQKYFDGMKVSFALSRGIPSVEIY